MGILKRNWLENKRNLTNGETEYISWGRIDGPGKQDVDKPPSYKKHSERAESGKETEYKGNRKLSFAYPSVVLLCEHHYQRKSIMLFLGLKIQYGVFKLF